MREHEHCPEVDDNELLRKAAQIHFDYKVKLSEMVRDFKYSDCKTLYELCDLVKGNNCAVDIYHVVPDLRDDLLNIMQWHKFNLHVHGIQLD